ncbi:MAG: nucleoside deaminase [Bacteroidota bacterium]
MHSDIHFMKQAILEAQKAYEKGEVPVGAVVVCEHQIIARAHNQTELLHDVTAHAEMLAITAAADHLGNKYLNDCTLYITLEPCPMCAGAIRWAQLGKIVYGASDDKRGFMNYGKRMLHPKTKVEFGILNEECEGLMTSFFAERR